MRDEKFEGGCCGKQNSFPLDDCVAPSMIEVWVKISLTLCLHSNEEHPTAIEYIHGMEHSSENLSAVEINSINLQFLLRVRRLSSLEYGAVAFDHCCFLETTKVDAASMTRYV